jgi:hypothetical protein
MNQLKLIFGFVFCMLMLGNNFASHIAGADITYKCVGQDSFEITVNIFRDCSGATLGNSSVQVQLTNTCDTITQNITLLQIIPPGSNLSAPGPIEVSQLCSLAINQSRCNNGTLPGMQQYIYKGIAVLTPNCNSWSIGYSVPCCRNTAVNLTNSSGFSSFVRATINTVSNECNSSPVFEAKPIPYYCINQASRYNILASDPDGDSLVYELVCGYTNSNLTPLQYTPPLLSCSIPMHGITINPQNGQIVFTPTVLGNFSIVVKVSEYDSIGNMKGTVMRDFQFVVQGCTSIFNVTASITNFRGNGTLVNANNIRVCYGDSVDFDIVFTSANVNDSINLFTNLLSVFPGLNYTLVSNANTTTATISGIITGIISKRHFGFEISNNNCPVNQVWYESFSIEVENAIYTGSDISICYGDTAQLSVSGGSQLQWSSISGPPLSVGNNFSCDTCKNVKAYPTATTTYEVSSNVPSCKNSDTITVFVALNFSLSHTPDTSICSNQDVQLTVTPSISGTFTYKWQADYGLNNYTIANPIAKPKKPTTFKVNVSSQAGCTKTTSILVDFHTLFPAIELSASDTIICLSSPLHLQSKLKQANLNCTSSNTNCIGNLDSYLTGAGTSTNTATSTNQLAFPTLFAGRFYSAKQQYLYRASQLKANGMEAGKIMGISIPVINTSGQVLLHNYSVKMGCTSLQAIQSNTFIDNANLHVVRNPSPYLVSFNATDSIMFNQAFEWDGESNLLIEICFDNTNLAISTLSHSAQVSSFSTNYASSAFTFTNIDNNGMCNSTTTHSTGSPKNLLPAISFISCQGVDTNAYVYSWSPTQAFTAPYNQLNMHGNVDTSHSGVYTFHIADTAGICADSSKINISIISTYNTKPDSVGPFCVNTSLTYLKVPTSGGVFAGNGIIDNVNGLFNPATAGVGKHTITYEISGTQCDNKDSIEIDVLPPDSTHINYSTCVPYVFNNILRTSSGTYSANYSNEFSCDSVVILHLTITPHPSSNLTMSTCNSYNFNGQIITNTGTYYDTISTANGCDSVVALNIVIGYDNSSVVYDTACSVYFINGIPYTVGGTYNHTLYNSMGCDSNITLHLIIDSIDVSVSTNNYTLIANANGVQYQWLDCSFGKMPIPGQTNKSFTPVANGSYAVLLHNGICVDTSGCFPITNVGINEIEQQNFRVYPNPATDEVLVQFSENSMPESISLQNIMGQTIYTIYHPTGNVIRFDVSDLSSGLYFIQMQIGQKVQRAKLIKN